MALSSAGRNGARLPNWRRAWLTQKTDIARSLLSLTRAGLIRRQLLRAMGLSVGAVATTGLLAACEVDDDTETEVVDDADDDEVAGVDTSDDDPGTDDDQSDDAAPLDEPDDSADDNSDAQPAEDGERPELRIAAHNIVTQLDPYSNRSLIGHMTQYSIFETLIRRDWFDSDPPGLSNTLEPMLAES
jgi:hypothetical protein